MTVTEARASLPELLDRVIEGEEVTITRHGKPVAVVIRPDTLRVRRGDEVLAIAADVHAGLERGRRSRLSRPTVTPERAKALVDEVRASRSR
jgi:antitoxin (DNA-binding transcriptional repressor) of toxin-antitoxin stability system